MKCDIPNCRIHYPEQYKEKMRLEEEKFIDELAHEAYSSYGAVTDFKNFRGEPMPEFDVLPDVIKNAWRAAAKTVAILAVDKV
jgi:hypothetical protein